MVDSLELNIRQLNLEDLEAMIEINSEHKKNMGLPKTESYNDLFIKNTYKYFEKKNRYILGYFSEGQLISYIGVIRWLDMPYWTFTAAKARLFWRSNMTFKPETNGIAALIRKVINDEARLGRFTYWFMTSLKRNQGHRVYWSSFIPELKDYFLISRVIEKNYRPEDPRVWSMMGEQQWGEDLILRIGVEKNHTSDLMPLFDLLQIPLEKKSLEDEDNDLILHC